MQSVEERAVGGGRWQRVAIGLGSNLNDRLRQLELAVLSIAPSLTCGALSQPLESSPVGAPAGSPDFLNAVLVGLTKTPPDGLLATFKAIEYQAGRRAAGRNAPRPLDCDLLLYGALTCAHPELTLPHPRLRERRFWLLPLQTVAPDLRIAPESAFPGLLAEPAWRSWTDPTVFAAAGIRVVPHAGASDDGTTQGTLPGC